MTTTGARIAEECGVTVDPEETDSLSMVAALLGIGKFTDLLNALPPEFFTWSVDDKAFAWGVLLTCINRGCYDVEALAGIVKGM